VFEVKLGNGSGETARRPIDYAPPTARTWPAMPDASRRGSRGDSPADRLLRQLGLRPIRWAGTGWAWASSGMREARRRSRAASSSRRSR